MQGRKFVILASAALVVVHASSVVAQNVDMGATFDAISSTATEVETTFRDARAVTRKQANGRLDTVLYDLDGNALITLDREPSRPFIDLGAPNARWRHRIQLPPQTQLSADWNNAQIWQLWRDAQIAKHDLAAAVLPPVAMRGRLLRFRAVDDAETRAKTQIDIDDETMSVQTRFPRYVALATKKEGRTLRPGGVYATFTARLQSLDGVTLGYIRFFKKERIVSWTFGSGERGVVREENVKGGFKFTPNMAWANVQAVRFHENPPKNPVPASAFANQSSSCAAGSAPATKSSAKVPSPGLGGTAASLKSRLLSWFGGLRFLSSRQTGAAFEAQIANAGMALPFGRWLAGKPSAPALSSTSTAGAAQTPCDGQSDGCTGLHWLDGSLFRPCCDRHDVCFEKDCSTGGCTKWSWIKFWDSWHCTGCNITAVLCFITFNGGGGAPDGGGSGGGDAGEWCDSDLDCPDGYTCEWNGRCDSWF